MILPQSREFFFRLGFGFGVSFEAADDALARNVVGDPVEGITRLLAVYRCLDLAEPDGFWKSHFRRIDYRRILCGNCAGIKRILVLLGKSGAPNRS